MPKGSIEKHTRMNESLNITIKIGGAAQGLNEVKTLSNGIKAEMDKVKKSLSLSNLGSFNTFKSGISDIQSGLKGLGNQAAIATTALGGVLVGAAVQATKSFIGFEDQLANVRKTVGLTAEQAKKVGDELIRYSRTTRTSIGELVDIATVGGQLGVAEKDILSFTKAIDKLTVALGDEFAGGATQITQEVGVLRNLFTDIKSDKIDQDLLRIGNALNVLGTRGLATAPVVTDFATRISGLTGGLKVSSGDVLGLSAALQELGVNAERGGSNVGRIFNILAKDSEKIAKTLGLNVKDFQRLVNTDINEAFLLVAKRVRELGTENTKFSQLLEELGLDATGASEVLQKVGGSLDLVRGSQEAANRSLGDTNSILDEYNIKNSTTQANLDKLGNTINGVAIEIGGTLAPYVEKLAVKFGELATEYAPKVISFFENDLIPAAKEVVEFLAPIIKSIIEFVQQHPEIIKLGLAFGALSLAVRTFNLIFGPAMTLLSGLGKVLFSAIVNIPMVQAGMAAIGETIAASSSIFGGAFKTAFSAIPWATIGQLVGPLFAAGFVLVVGNELGKWLAEQKWFQDLTGYTAEIQRQQDEMAKASQQMATTLDEFKRVRDQASSIDPNVQNVLGTLPADIKANTSLLQGFVNSDFKSFKAYVEDVNQKRTTAEQALISSSTGIANLVNATKNIASSANSFAATSNTNADEAVNRIKGISPVINSANANAEASNYWSRAIGTNNTALTTTVNNVPGQAKNQLLSSPLFQGLKLIGGIFGLKFAEGGIVPGNAYNGDKVIARVNSGEMVLNKGQQANLFKMLNQPQQNKTVNVNGVNFMQSQAAPQQQLLSFTDMLSQAI